MEDIMKKLNETIEEQNKEISYLKERLRVDQQHRGDTIASDRRLSQNEITRYSRQLLMPQLGVSGQLALKNTSVLIVGAGGLGCPSALYLSAAGIGRIGIVDHDSVDLSNLHRQIAHTTKTLGSKKTLSLKRAVLERNDCVRCDVYDTLLNSSNIEKIIEPYSIIVDASDNVPTRYLLNDAAVLFDKRLVSGAALKFEGQLTVYNYKDGPCYRCLFPEPPKHSLGNCSDNGVLGTVTGTIGCLQALEVIKLATGLEPGYYKRMLLFDGLSGDFRAIKLRSKQVDCKVCGDNPIIKHLADYELLCAQPIHDKVQTVSLLSEHERISCIEYKNILDRGKEHILIDVRPAHELEICCLPNAVSIPMSDISKDTALTKLEALVNASNLKEHFVICRRGNDSQKAVQTLKELFKICVWKDIKGGYYAWYDEVDSNIAIY